jgi:arylformamidase
MIYDISVPIYPGMVVWEDEEPVKLEPLSRLEDGGLAAVSRFSCGTHTGTHVDPPRHFIEGGAGVDEMPLDAMVGPCVVRRFNERFEITALHLEEAGIPDGTERLLLATPGAELWDLPEFRMEYTGLAPDGADWCLRRGIRLVGIDYLSIERADSPTAFQTHKTLLGAGVVVLEGLDMRGVPEGSYTLACLPLMIKNGDGSLARAILVTGDQF